LPAVFGKNRKNSWRKKVPHTAGSFGGCSILSVTLWVAGTWGSIPAKAGKHFGQGKLWRLENPGKTANHRRKESSDVKIVVDLLSGKYKILNRP